MGASPQSGMRANRESVSRQASRKAWEGAHSIWMLYLSLHHWACNTVTAPENATEMLLYQRDTLGRGHTAEGDWYCPYTPCPFAEASNAQLVTQDLGMLHSRAM